jgi:peptidoglycan LD-endopeptidase CwlK
MDNPTLLKILKLHPSVRDEVKKIIEECDKALTGKAKVRITQGLRTFKEQDGLYNLGRTVANPVGKTPKKTLGNIVTNAKGGQSIHNYGFAVDIVLIIDGKVASWDTKKDWDQDKVSDWDECVKVFAKHGWEWGGNWAKFKDMPHFDKKNFNNWKTLSKLEKDKNGYVIL